MKSILVWGIGTDYARFRRMITGIKEIDGFEIKALISSHKEAFTSLDNMKIILPQDIYEYQYDYIVVASKKHYFEIVKQANDMGITDDIFILSEIFENNNFIFDLYIKLRESRLSIVSDDCWGGLLYHTYGLQFNSPFINTAISSDDYMKLINNIEYYLDLPLIIEENGSVSQYPICSLGGEIKILMWHYSSGEEAKICWNRRVKRFNIDNYFVKMCCQNEKEAYEFSEINIQKKVGFYFKDLGLDSVLFMKEWQDPIIRKQYSHQFFTYIRDQLYNNRCSSYNALKILNGYFDVRKK